MCVHAISSIHEHTIPKPGHVQIIIILQIKTSSTSSLSSGRDTYDTSYDAAFYTKIYFP